MSDIKTLKATVLYEFQPAEDRCLVTVKAGELLWACRGFLYEDYKTTTEMMQCIFSWVEKLIKAYGLGNR